MSALEYEFSDERERSNAIVTHKQPCDCEYCGANNEPPDDCSSLKVSPDTVLYPTDGDSKATVD